jgi:hypothetical protein
VRNIVLEFDGYFEGKFEPFKHIRVDISYINEKKLTEFANRIRLRLKQKSFAMKYNKQLILISQG